jgi:hypothetical protein
MRVPICATTRPLRCLLTRLPRVPVQVSGSDDFTLYLWDPTVSKQPVERMTGQRCAAPVHHCAALHHALAHGNGSRARHQLWLK